jgi:16S rRNA C1402 (ribose-2'-O) methylase RsmI
LWVFSFLPRKEAEVKKLIAKLYVVHGLLDDTVFIAFDSPERIAASVTIIHSAYPSAEIHIARELTKKFEELIIASSPTADLSQIKGECVIVMRFVR